MTTRSCFVCNALASALLVYSCSRSNAPRSESLADGREPQQVVPASPSSSAPKDAKPASTAASSAAAVSSMSVPASGGSSAPASASVSVSAGAQAKQTSRAAAGSGGAAGTAGAAGIMAAAQSPSTTSGGAVPKLPEIKGECPKFATGDWSFSGLTGVMVAGTKSEGSAPLVFYWAGTDFDASTYTQIGDKNVKRVTSEGGLIVSVQGSAQHALDTDCSITGYYSHDFVPIGQIAACAVRDFGIDPTRIYATGCSAGGVTSGCMATRCSSYIAAVATNSGGLTSVEKLEDPSHAPAVMSMHGGAADFGGLFTTDSANLDMAIKDAGGFAINCDHGGAHCGASAELYDAAFDFLWAHPFGVEPEPYKSGLPMGFPSYCKIY